MAALIETPCKRVSKGLNNRMILPYHSLHSLESLPCQNIYKLVYFPGKINDQLVSSDGWVREANLIFFLGFLE